MRLRLPNNDTIILPGKLNYAERLELVNDVLEKHNNYFTDAWETDRVKTCLHMLTSYLSRAKDFKDKEYPTASINESAILDGRRKSKHYTRFSDLRLKDQYQLGLKDSQEDSYE